MNWSRWTPDLQVVNPVRRALEKTIRRVRSRLAAARDRRAAAQQEQRRDTASLDADAKAIAGELEELKQQRADLPTHVRAGDLSEQDKLDALPVGRRLFMDVVRMLAYRAETRMLAPVLAAQGKKPNARRLLRALLTSDANLIPEPDQGILRVQLLGLGSAACEPHAGAVDQGTQRHPYALSRHRTHPGLRNGRRSPRSTCQLIPAEVRKSCSGPPRRRRCGSRRSRRSHTPAR